MKPTSYFVQVIMCQIQDKELVSMQNCKKVVGTVNLYLQPHVRHTRTPYVGSLRARVLRFGVLHYVIVSEKVILPQILRGGGGQSSFFNCPFFKPNCLK